MKRPEKKDLSPGERVVFAAVGALLIAYGWLKIYQGKWIYTNYRGLDVPALFVLFLGVFALVGSVFPWSRVKILWDVGRKKQRR